MNSNTQSVEEKYSSKISEMTEENAKTVAGMEEDFERRMKQVKKELTTISKVKEELELQLSIERKRGSDKETELSERLRRAEQAHQQMMQKVESMENSQSSTIREK